jgi:hypothetical protein
MKVEQPFIKFHPIEAPLELSDPFASLTAAEMVYLEMDAPPALQAPMLGASTPLPPPLTLTKKAATMMMTTRRRTSSSHATTLFFSLFGVLMTKGEK